MEYLAKNIVNKRTVQFFVKIVGSHLNGVMLRIVGICMRLIFQPGFQMQESQGVAICADNYSNSTN